MAQNLRARFSPARCVRLSKRFIRMCTQISGAEQLIPDVQNAIKDVQQKESLFNAADENVDYAYDITQLKDSNLDNAIRDTAEDCKRFDRNNLGSQVYSLIFPQNTLSIIDKNYKQEPAEVSKLISRIHNLGPDHTLQQNATRLQQLVKESEDAIKNFAETEKIKDSCQEDLNASKQKLIQVYNNTILKSIQLFGKNNTDKLFPSIKSKKKTIDQNSNTPAEKTVVVG